MMKTNVLKKTNNVIGVGIIGCGYFGEKRISECLKIPNKIKIIGVSDINQSVLNKINNKYHVPVTIRPETLFGSGLVDAVIVCVPNKYHKELSIKALRSGKCVLCEKPLADNSQNARAIHDAAKKTGRFVKTGSNHRFFPAVIKASNLYKQGKIGKLLRFQGSIGTSGKRTANGWFWNKKLSGGGTYIDNACHLLDIARMFMGDFIKCSGSIFNLYWKRAGVEDFGVGQFVAKTGGVAVISSSWTQWSGYMYFELWGDGGFIIVDSRGDNRVVLGNSDGKILERHNFSSLPITSYREELLYFVDCLQKNIEPHPNAYDGLRVIQMIDGVYQSHKRRTWVNI